MIKKIYNSPLRRITIASRYGSTFMFKKESVCEHTMDMIVCAMEFDSYLKDSGLIQFFIEIGYSIENTIFRISNHDLDESVSDDVSREIKHFDEDIKHHIDRVSQEVLKRAGIHEDILDSIRTAKDLRNINGLLVKVFDLVQARFVILKEVQRGNVDFQEKEVESKEYIQILIYDLQNHLNDVYPPAVIKILTDFLKETLTLP